jgi:TonB family protein
LWGQEDVPTEEVAPFIKVAPTLKQLELVQVPEGTSFPSSEVAVVLKIEIDPEGKVTQVEIAQGLGEPFDSAAMEAARKSLFTPAILNTGEAVSVTINFTLKIQEPPPPPPPPVLFDGTLLQRGTRKPLVAVTVLARGTEGVLAEATTDERGRFSLEVPEAIFVLVAVPPGHEKLKVTVEAVPGEERAETFYLESVGSGYEATVRADRVAREVTKRVIPREIVLTAAGTQGDAIRIIESLPGVNRAPFGGGSQLVLRGSNPQDSNSYIEGMEVPLLYHFGGLRSTFNSAFLDSLEFVPGNFSPEYGRAVGGMIDVKVRDPADDLFRGEVDLNLYDAGFVLEGPVSERWSLGGAFHRSYIDTLLPAVLPSDLPVTFDALPRYYDYQFLATWKGDNSEKFRVIFFGSNDKFIFAFDDEEDDGTTIRNGLSIRSMFHNLQAIYESKVSEKIRHKSSARLGLTDLSFSFGPDVDFQIFNYQIAARSTWIYQALDNLEFMWGLDQDVNFVDLKLNIPRAPLEGEEQVPFGTLSFLEQELDKKVFWNNGAFVNIRWSPVESLELQTGLRFDRYTLVDGFTLDPRFVARWNIGADTVLKGGVGYFQQRPEYGQTDSVFGSENLMHPRSLHTSVGFEHTFTEGLTLDMTGFYKYNDRTVVANPDAFVTSDAETLNNDGTGRIYGVELLAKANLEKFQGWIAYTYQRSFRTDRPGEEERLFDLDQPHNLTILGVYRFNNKWSFSARYRLISGTTYTPVVDAEFDTVTGEYFPLYGENNASRLDAFQQLDVRLDRNWIFDTWTLNLYLDIQNVTNKGNAEARNYNYDFTQSDNITGLPILPLLGVKGSW